MPSITEISKGKTCLPVTRKITVIITCFSRGLSKAIRHQGVRSRHTSYLTNPTYHLVRTNKYPNTGSSKVSTQWSLQPWTGLKPHQTVHNTLSGSLFDIFCVKLGEDYTRSLDSLYSSRLYTRVYQPSTQSTNLVASPRDGQSTGLIKRGGEVRTELKKPFVQFKLATLAL